MFERLLKIALVSAVIVFDAFLCHVFLEAIRQVIYYKPYIPAVTLVYLETNLYFLAAIVILLSAILILLLVHSVRVITR